MKDYILWPDGVVGDHLKDIHEEYKKAEKNYPSFNSAHEGISVLREEFEEAWDLVKVKQMFHDKKAMKLEMIQIAAMALRFITDVCDKEEK